MRTKFSMAALAALSMFTVANASSLAQALQNGKISGEVAVTYETRNVDKEISNYYQDTGYSVGSFALRYESASYNNFKLVAKARAYANIWEDDKDSTTSHGTGDASERFWEDGSGNKDGDIEELYISYNNNFDGLKTDIKVGRQPLNTIWLNKTNDAFNANFSYENTDLELIWTKGFGRVYARDYRPINDINKEDHGAGVYKAQLTQHFGDVAVTGFGLFGQDYKNIYGGQIAYDTDMFGIKAQYSQTDEEVTTTKDSDHLQLKAYAKFAGYKLTLAHLITDKDAAFKHYGRGTTNDFEEGDHIYKKDAKTTYVALGKTFGDFSATALYGITDYEGQYDMSEFDLWLGYKINKELSVKLGYTMTNEDDSDANSTDLQQINTTFVYKF